MKKLFLLGIFCVLGQQAIAHDEASYCSMVADDGAWAFTYGFGGPTYQCNRAYDYLVRSTFSTIRLASFGDYDLFEMNKVWVNCWTAGGTFWDYGSEPLDDAYQAASLGRYQGCQFFVE